MELTPGPMLQISFCPWFADFRSKLECLLDRLEKLTNDKHSSLFLKYVIYGQKSFITLGPDVFVGKCSFVFEKSIFSTY